ncbi:MAG: maleylpyruvate isomerase N-terminal domain-containing protein [Actinomycetota bacterium]
MPAMPAMPDSAFAPPADIVDILAAECAACAAVATTLSEDDFGLPTRCPPWDVKALVGHIWRDVDRILVYAAEPAPHAADSDALAYYGVDYDPVASAPDVMRRGFEAAAAFATGHELARDFDDRWRRAVDLARSTPPERLIRTFGPCLRLDQYLCTRLLEAAVHGLDLADAIEREPWITPRATALVRSMLVAMLGAEPPEPLGWDDLAFLEAGTGRRPVAPEERAVLGPLAERFPLLS